jgi:hypothetical protein
MKCKSNILHRIEVGGRTAFYCHISRIEYRYDCFGRAIELFRWNYFTGEEENYGTVAYGAYVYAPHIKSERIPIG